MDKTKSILYNDIGRLVRNDNLTAHETRPGEFVHRTVIKKF